MLKKKSVKGTSKVSVTFETKAFEHAGRVTLAGEFNDWNPDATPMKRRKKDAAWATTIRLEQGADYQYRYVVDGEWVSDEEADGAAVNEFGTTNSIVTT